MVKKSKEDIEFAKLFNECKTKGIKSIDTCYHPDCSKKSINSHILQKNGILSEIATDRHLWEQVIDQFKTPHLQFKKTGINEIFSFKCFCNEHDTDLFKKIEKQDIDFEDYESCLLFTLRTVYNEIYRKQVNIKMYECLISKEPENFDNPATHEYMRQENLGLGDLAEIEKDIWNDLKNGSESFVFKSRELPRIDICLSAFYNYDTSQEMHEYIQIHGKDMDRVSDIFINWLQYKEATTLLMGYNKKDEKKVKANFYTFFKEKEKRVTRYLTNLVLFRCETWVCSDAFYTEYVKGFEDGYAATSYYSTQTSNERKIHPLNFYDKNFKKQLKEWMEKYGG